MSFIPLKVASQDFTCFYKKTFLKNQIQGQLEISGICIVPFVDLDLITRRKNNKVFNKIKILQWEIGMGFGNIETR